MKKVITLCIDTSGSMINIKKEAQKGINKILKKFPDIEFNIVTFGGEPVDDIFKEGDPCSFELAKAKKVVKGKLGKDVKFNLVPYGCTPLFDGFVKAVKMLNLQEDNYFVLISDGEENSSQKHSKKDLDLLSKIMENSNVRLEFIGLEGFDAVNSSIAYGNAYLSVSAANYSVGNSNIAFHRTATNIVDWAEEEIQTTP